MTKLLRSIVWPLALQAALILTSLVLAAGGDWDWG